MGAKTAIRVFTGIVLLVQFSLPALAERKTPYRFAQNHVTPLAALQDAAKLMSRRSDSVISQPELDVFTKIAAGHPEDCDAVDAFLIASGVTDSQKRQLFYQKFDIVVFHLTILLEAQ